MPATRNPALTAGPGIDAMAMTVTPMSVRTDYQMSTRGHRITGTLRGQMIIDTGWHSTVTKAATGYARAFAAAATVNAARYLDHGRP